MRQRDSDATRARIISAVGEVLKNGGFRTIGINAIARTAGVDKVLIYRYFGSLNALLGAFAQQSAIWPSVEELLEASRDAREKGTLSEAASALLMAHLRALRARPLALELMRWELLERNELTEVLARVREEQGKVLLERMMERFPSIGGREDWIATAALLFSGVTYLLLRSHTADVYMGLELDRDAGWEKIEAAVERMVAATLSGVGDEA